MSSSRSGASSSKARSSPSVCFEFLRRRGRCRSSSCFTRAVERGGIDARSFDAQVRQIRPLAEQAELRLPRRDALAQPHDVLLDGLELPVERLLQRAQRFELPAERVDSLGCASGLRSSAWIAANCSSSAVARGVGGIEAVEQRVAHGERQIPAAGRGRSCSCRAASRRPRAT